MRGQVLVLLESLLMRMLMVLAVGVRGMVVLIPLVMVAVAPAMALVVVVMPLDSASWSRLTCLWVRLTPVCSLLAAVLIAG